MLSIRLLDKLIDNWAHRVRFLKHLQAHEELTCNLARVRSQGKHVFSVVLDFL
jgi:hypothetical protein